MITSVINEVTIAPKAFLEQIFHGHLHLGVNEHARARHLPRAFGDGQALLQRDFARAQGIEHQIGGHQLGQGGWFDRLVNIFGSQNLAACRYVHQHVGARGDVGRLGQGLGGGRQSGCGEKKRGQRAGKSRHFGMKKGEKTGKDGSGSSQGAQMARGQPLEQRQLSVKEMPASGNNRDGK